MVSHYPNTHSLTHTRLYNIGAHQVHTETKNTLLAYLCVYFALHGPQAFYVRGL